MKAVVDPNAATIMAQFIFDQWLECPRAQDVLKRLVADEQLTKRQVYQTGFLQGAIAMLEAFNQSSVAIMKAVEDLSGPSRN
jgi:hypothetical protein